MPVHSFDDGLGNKTYVDENNNVVGHSMSSAGGQVEVFYDSDGNVVGHSEQSLFGNDRAYYDADGNRTGNSFDGSGGNRYYIGTGSSGNGFSHKGYVHGTDYYGETPFLKDEDKSPSPSPGSSSGTGNSGSGSYRFIDFNYPGKAIIRLVGLILILLWGLANSDDFLPTLGKTLLFEIILIVATEPRGKKKGK